MCNPQALFAGQAALGGAQAQGGRAQARAGLRAQRKVHKLNRFNALNDANQNYNQLNRQLVQRREALAGSLENVTRQARELDARARVSAGESGVTGSSVTALLDEFERFEAEHVFAAERQGQFFDEALANSFQEIHSQATGRIQSTTPNPLGVPGAFGTTLAITSSTIDAFGNWTYWDPGANGGQGGFSFGVK